MKHRSQDTIRTTIVLEYHHGSRIPMFQSPASILFQAQITRLILATPRLLRIHIETNASKRLSKVHSRRYCRNRQTPSGGYRHLVASTEMCISETKMVKHLRHTTPSIHVPRLRSWPFCPQIPIPSRNRVSSLLKQLQRLSARADVTV